MLWVKSRRARYLLQLTVSLLLAGTGCAALRGAKGHPSQERLNHLAAPVAPCFSVPMPKDFIQVLRPSKYRLPEIWIPTYKQRVYLSDRLLAATNDRQLTMLLAHGAAHYELEHLKKRSYLSIGQSAAWFIAGTAVPGLGLIDMITNPLVDVTVGARQEFRADVKALSCLEQQGYTVEEYVGVLELMRDHDFIEKTVYLKAGDRTFGHRIEAVKQLDAKLKE